MHRLRSDITTASMAAVVAVVRDSRRRHPAGRPRGLRNHEISPHARIRGVKVDMKPIVILGVIVALLGVLALAVPHFTTNDTKNVVTLGDLKVQATVPTSHSVPPILGGAAIIIGLVMAGGGLYQKS